MRELLERVLVSGVSAGLGLLGRRVDLEFFEEHLPHLPGTRHVEFFACQIKDALLNFGDALAEERGVGGERVRVKSHAGKLHVGKDGYERHVDVMEHPRHVGVGLDHGRQLFIEAEGDLGVFGGVVENVRVGHILH